MKWLVSMLAVLATTAATLTVTAVPAAAASPDGSLYFSVDHISSPSPGRVRVQGWIFDADLPAASVSVHVYVGGVGYDIGPANLYRPDVHSAYGAGEHHGFDHTLDVSSTGSQTVSVHGINVPGTTYEGYNPLMGQQGVFITNPQPGGVFDAVTSPAPGQVRVSGWAADQSDLGQKTKVEIRIGATLAGSLVADQLRPEMVGSPAGGNIGFAGTLPSPAGVHTVCATALNIGAGSHQSLGCSQITVAPVPPAPPVQPPTTTPPAGAIALRVTAVKRRSRIKVDVGPGRDPSNYRIKVQRRARGTWRTVLHSQTLGAKDVIVIDRPRGRYRIVVPGQFGLTGARATVRLRR